MKKLEKKMEDMMREHEQKTLEYDAMLEMLTGERDRTMETNQQLENQVEDLQSELELAKQKANWVDTLEREKTRLVTIRDQLERKVSRSPPANACPAGAQERSRLSSVRASLTDAHAPAAHLQVKDLQTDIADHQTATKKMKEEFAEMLAEVKAAREEKAEHIQTAADLVEVSAELQTAKRTIEVRRAQHAARVHLAPVCSAWRAVLAAWSFPSGAISAQAAKRSA